MFECKYKFEIEDSVVSAKYVYKSQRRKQDKVIAILIPILMVCIVAMLIYDIVTNHSVIWDVILLVALVVLESLYIAIPVVLVRSQKKSYKKQNLGDMDYLLVQINDTLCTEKMFKDEKEVAQNVHNLKQLTSYLEDESRIVLVFNNIEYVCLRKNSITGDAEKLKTHLQKTMSKNLNKKPTK